MKTTNGQSKKVLYGTPGQPDPAADLLSGCAQKKRKRIN
jgi:hypothetical protein